MKRSGRIHALYRLDDANLFNLQRRINFFQSIVDVLHDLLEIVCRRGRASLLKHALRFAELRIRRALRLLAFAVTMWLGAQFLAGSLDMTHRFFAMAFVIMVGHFQDVIGLLELLNLGGFLSNGQGPGYYG